jgi:pilus assembly protein CpaE
MFSVIAGDSPTVATKLRKALAAHGHECPITHVVGLEQVEAALQSARQAVDLLMVILPGDHQRSLVLLRRLRSATSARLVAVGSARDPRHILESLHAGADDFLDDEADVGEQVAASLERLTAQPGSAGSHALVAVTSASGGSGCTMLAANLAVTFARRAGSCGLVDLAGGFGDLAAHFNLTPRHTLGDLLRNQDTLDRDMLIQCLMPHETGVKLLAAPNLPDDADGATPHAVERIVHFVRGEFPWNVLDLDARNRRNYGVLRAASVILLVFRLDFSSLCNARRMLNEWQEHQIDEGRVHLIANRCGQSSEIPASQIQSVLGKKITMTIPDDPHAANVSINCGNPAVRDAPKSPLSKALTATADLLLGTTAGSETAAGQGPAPDARPHDMGVLRRAAGILFC